MIQLSTEWRLFYLVAICSIVAVAIIYVVYDRNNPIDPEIYDRIYKECLSDPEVRRIMKQNLWQGGGDLDDYVHGTCRTVASRKARRPRTDGN